MMKGRQSRWGLRKVSSKLGETLKRPDALNSPYFHFKSLISHDHQPASNVRRLVVVGILLGEEYKRQADEEGLWRWRRIRRRR